MSKRCGWGILAAAVTVAAAGVFLPRAANADYGGFRCVVNYSDCSFPDGVCSNMCEQVADGENGDGILCTEIDTAPWLPGMVDCALSGGACNYTVINGNKDLPPPGSWCPDGQVC